ncbi:MAG: hypothetical protein MI810_13500 [Flavobacteriales bacterium]|nr:hypothetical protein [Flavobacteriales bacterium]
MIVIGTEEYDLTNFNQDLCQCPNCGKRGVFVRKYANSFQINSHPIYSKGVGYSTICRKCNSAFQKGDDRFVDAYIDQEMAALKKPFWLNIGVLLFPLGILGFIAFITILSK